jgi:hypothetical protein
MWGFLPFDHALRMYVCVDKLMRHSSFLTYSLLLYTIDIALSVPLLGLEWNPLDNFVVSLNNTTPRLPIVFGLEWIALLFLTSVSSSHRGPKVLQGTRWSYATHP